MSLPVPMHVYVHVFFHRSMRRLQSGSVVGWQTCMRDTEVRHPEGVVQTSFFPFKVAVIISPWIDAFDKKEHHSY